MCDILPNKKLSISTLTHFMIWSLLLMLFTYKTDTVSHGVSYTKSSNGTITYKKLSINDYRFMDRFTKAAWCGQTTVSEGKSIYSRENHLKVVSDWSGIRTEHALPFGYSPTMLLILWPFSRLTTNQSFFLFNLIGLIAVWWISHPSRCRNGLGILVFFTPLAFACFHLGQTALLTAAGILLIAEKTRNGDDIQNWTTILLISIALWGLTAKPPLALTAGAVLVSLRQWRPLSIAALLTIISTVSLTPLMGTGWVQDYISLLTSYNIDDIGETFARSLYPPHMANLRGILHVDVGITDRSASTLSSAIWLIVLFCIAFDKIPAWISTKYRWALAIIAYLLFCPHVTATEMLHSVLLLPLCLPTVSELRREEMILLMLGLFMPLLSPGTIIFWENRIPLFLLMMISVLVIFGYEKRTYLQQQHESICYD